ncbi:hypothetical protein ID866_10128 [Astraeus odoratus]|nr:hypothetical protein ID866_10128 [Astraeus odoratus]
MSKISADKFYNPYRWIAFARLIRFALARQQFSLAISLYDRLLDEGFAPLSCVRARITGLKLVASSAKLQDAVAPLKEVFADEAYDSTAFLQLLYFILCVKKVPVAFINDLTHTYMSIKRIKPCTCSDLIGEVISINMRAGHLGTAQRWLRAFQESCEAEDVRMDATPYADLLDMLMRVDPRNTPALRTVLEDMKAAGVYPNVSIFNTLIRVNIKQERYREAYELYRTLMRKRSAQLMPNDVTFKILLRATRLISQKRRAKRPENVVEPWQIFRDMLECHLHQTEGQPLARSTSLSASSLQTALRTFIARGDYLAAFIVVRSIDFFGFSANLQSYRIVLAHLLSRFKREMKSARHPRERRLVDYFREHLSNGASLSEDAPSSMTGIGIISCLLNESRCQSDNDLYAIWPSVNVDPSSQAHRRRPMQVPTMPVLMGEETLPCNDRCPSVPLARLLQKAFLGSLWANSPHLEKHWEGIIEKVVGDAKKRMVPPIIAPKPEKAKDLRRHLERKEGLPFAASRRRRSARAGWEIEITGEDDMDL